MSSLNLFALILFLLSYILMFSFRKLRPHVAVTSALISTVVGSLGVFPGFDYNWADAFRQIDFNVILMIVGTMGTVNLFILSKMPRRLGDIILSKVSTVKWAIVALSLFAGIISAFVDNVATVLMVAPVAAALCAKLGISPVPAIICISVSSNLQGAATLVGDTTSVLLGKAAGMDFADFFFMEGKPGMFWVTEAGALISALVILWICRKDDTSVSSDDIYKVEDMFPTGLLVGTVVTLIAASFIPYRSAALPGQFYKPEMTNGLICIFYFVVGLIRQAIREKSLSIIKRSFREIDYGTIVLLAGLFVMIGGINKAGIIELIGSLLSSLASGENGGSVFLIYPNRLG